MSLEEFGDQEAARAINRQMADQEREAQEALIDPESEEALEAKRVKDAEWDKYCDDVPKGYGNTKRI